MEIINKIYSIKFNVGSVIYINTFSIEYKYRGLGYSRRILNNIQSKYKLPIVLECYPTLYNYYTKLGFIKLGDTVDGYFEMERLTNLSNITIITNQ